MFKVLAYLFNTTMNGFTFILNIIYTGVSTIIIFVLKILNKIFKNKFDKSINKLLEKDRPEAILLACIYILSFTTIFSLVYSPGQKVVDLSKNDDIPKVEEKVEDPAPQEESLIADYSYARFSKMSLSEVDFNWLQSINEQTVAWISVDGTNINYPVVLTSDNDFYLTHNFTKDYTHNGWIFMDYRNRPMSDYNVIFYGHNLLNKGGFGSVSKLFTKKWFNNTSHNIIVLTPGKKYTYKIFSVYISEPVVDYLQVDFYSDSEYQNWLNGLASKDTMGFGETVTSNDKIITLSTCTEDNKGRKVVHAKLISEETF